MNKTLVWVLVALAVLVVAFLVLRGGEAPVVEDIDMEPVVEEVLDMDPVVEEEEEEEEVTEEPVADEGEAAEEAEEM